MTADERRARPSAGSRRDLGRGAPDHDPEASAADLIASDDGRDSEGASAPMASVPRSALRITAPVVSPSDADCGAHCRSAGRHSRQAGRPPAASFRSEEDPPHVPSILLRPIIATAGRGASSCGSGRMARRRPSTRFCSASSLSPSSSRSSSSGTCSAACSRTLRAASPNAPGLGRKLSGSNECRPADGRRSSSGRQRQHVCCRGQWRTQPSAGCRDRSPKESEWAHESDGQQSHAGAEWPL